MSESAKTVDEVGALDGGEVASSTSGVKVAASPIGHVDVGEAAGEGRLLNRAPNRATPIEPPIERKKLTDEVATPRSPVGTAFWAARTSVCMLKPMPMPRTTM